MEALVAENESLHDRVAQQAMQLEAKASDTAAAVAATDTDKARLQVWQQQQLVADQSGQVHGCSIVPYWLVQLGPTNAFGNMTSGDATYVSVAPYTDT